VEEEGGWLIMLRPTPWQEELSCYGYATGCAGTAIAIAGVVNSAAQFLVGLTNRALGPAWGYRSTLVYTVILIFALLLLYKNLRRRNVRKI